LARTAQAMRAVLLASATATFLAGILASSFHDPGMLVGMGEGVTDYGCRADNQEASQVAVAWLRYAAEHHSVSQLPKPSSPDWGAKSCCVNGMWRQSLQ
jgi:hypothetical protein